MVDTARTVSALQTLFADNTNGDISPQDLRDFLVSVMGRTKHVWVGAGAFILTTGTPSRAIVGDTATTEDKVDGWAFDAASDEAITANLLLPADWDGGVITVKFYVSPTSTNTGSVRWALRVGDIAAGDQVDEAAAHIVVDNFAMAGTDQDLEIETIGTFTPTSNYLRLGVVRDGNDAGDTYTGDAIFHGLALEYTAAY